MKKLSLALGSALAVAASFHPAAAGPQPPATGSMARSVTLDGVALGSALTPGLASLRYTVARDETDGLWHLWTFDGTAVTYPADFDLAHVVHATSVDGFAFTRTGNLGYAAGSSAPATFGASIEPPIAYLSASRDNGAWILAAWHANDSTGQDRWGQYNYNTSVSELPGGPSDLAVLHRGPLTATPAGPGGFHVGTFGAVNGQIYLRVDSAMGGLARFAYIPSVPPVTEAWGAYGEEAELFAGTSHYWFLAADPNDGRRAGYVHNAGRTLQCGGLLQTYYSIRNVDGSLAGNRLWYVESGDDGATWSAPQDLFDTPAMLTLDGTHPGSAAKFSNVEAVRHGDRVRVYFRWQHPSGGGAPVEYVAAVDSTMACDGQFVDSFE
jgi:hypothetical protein